MSYILLPLAENDLIGIWHFSAEQWGTDRADRYITDLERDFAAVAIDPALGRRRYDALPGYRYVKSGSHLIFYRMAGRVVEIARVLHERMDVPRYL